MMRKGVKKGKERREKQTQGFGERGEVGVGEGEGRDLRDGDELFWEMRKKKKKKLIGFRRKNKGKPT